MRVALWAYHEAGYRALRTLHAMGHEVLVMTKAAPAYVPAVDSLADALGLECLVSASDDTMLKALRAFGPDIGVSMYYPNILASQILELPRLKSYNFHPALLPRHRGCFSAPWAIIAGDTETGVSCHEMVAAVDAGRIACVRRLPITPSDTAFSLYYRLVDAAVELLGEMMEAAMSGGIVTTPQQGQSCYHSRVVPHDGIIDPNWPRAQAERFVRAMIFPPHPPARMMVRGDIHWVHSVSEYRNLIKQR